MRVVRWERTRVWHFSRPMRILLNAIELLPRSDNAKKKYNALRRSFECPKRIQVARLGKIVTLQFNIISEKNQRNTTIWLADRDRIIKWTTGSNNKISFKTLCTRDYKGLMQYWILKQIREYAVSLYFNMSLALDVFEITKICFLLPIVIYRGHQRSRNCF